MLKLVYASCICPFIITVTTHGDYTFVRFRSAPTYGCAAKQVGVLAFSTDRYSAIQHFEDSDFNMEQPSQRPNPGQNPSQRRNGENYGGRRPRGGGRGGPRIDANHSFTDRVPNMHRGGYRGPGSRGNNLHWRGRGQLGSDRNPSVPPLQPPPGLGGGGTFGVHPTKDAEPKEGEVAGKVQDEEAAEDADVCFICASPVVHTAVAPCNHRTCHICALRLRALYKTRACAHCRVGIMVTIVRSERLILVPG